MRIMYIRALISPGEAEKHLLLHLLPVYQCWQSAVNSHHTHPERFAEADHTAETDGMKSYTDSNKCFFCFQLRSVVFTPISSATLWPLASLLLLCL